MAVAVAVLGLLPQAALVLLWAVVVARAAALPDQSRDKEEGEGQPSKGRMLAPLSCSSSRYRHRHRHRHRPLARPPSLTALPEQAESPPWAA